MLPPPSLISTDDEENSESSFGTEISAAPLEKSQDPKKVVEASVDFFGDTVKFVKEKYATFALAETNLRQGSFDEDTIVELLASYEPNLPFLIPRNKSEENAFKDLAFSQQQLDSVVRRAEIVEKKQDFIKLEIDHLTSFNEPDQEKLNECWESKYTLDFLVVACHQLL